MPKKLNNFETDLLEFSFFLFKRKLKLFLFCFFGAIVGAIIFQIKPILNKENFVEPYIKSELKIINPSVEFLEKYDVNELLDNKKYDSFSEHFFDILRLKLTTEYKFNHFIKILTQNQNLNDYWLIKKKNDEMFFPSINIINSDKNLSDKLSESIYYIEHPSNFDGLKFLEDSIKYSVYSSLEEIKKIIKFYIEKKLNEKESNKLNLLNLKSEYPDFTENFKNYKFNETIVYHINYLEQQINDLKDMLKSLEYLDYEYKLTYSNINTEIKSIKNIDGKTLKDDISKLVAYIVYGFIIGFTINLFFSFITFILKDQKKKVYYLSRILLQFSVNF